jgi:hypothetical protein
MYSITSAFARYTAFIVLYPIGLAPGESECMILICLYFYDLLATSSAVFEAFYLRFSFTIHNNAVWTMYQALPFVKKKNLYADFFAAFPFSYYDFLRVCLTSCEVALSLYSHKLEFLVFSLE